MKDGIDMKDKKVAWAVGSFCTIALLILVALQVLNMIKYPYLAAAVFFIAMVYIVLLSKISCDNEEKKNRLIIIYLGITKFIFLFGSAYENKLWLDTKYEVPDEPLLIFAYVFVALLIDIDLIVFMKNKKTRKIAIYGIAVYLLVFLIGSVSINSYWVLMMAIPMLTAYTQFGNVKMISIGCIGIVIINVIGVAYRLTGAYDRLTDDSILEGVRWFDLAFDDYGIKIGNTPDIVAVYVLLTIIIILYAAVLIHSTVLIKVFNKEKRDMVVNEQERIDGITDKIIETGIEIKKNASDTKEYIEALDKSTKNSLDSINIISEKNESNVESVENQREMTESIVYMIEGVKGEVDKALCITEASLESLNKGRKSFEQLKEKSMQVSQYNAEVMNVINEFVENSEKVSNLSSGIAQLSEEINLIALNASVESAKAGKIGRGFSEIVKEVIKLARKTADLTTVINNTVRDLQNNALNAKSVADNVVTSVSQENRIIDDTVQEYINIQNNMNILGNNVEEIVNSVNNVSIYNSDINKHINQLTEFSKKTNEYVNDVQLLYEGNKIRTDDTNNTMKHMIEIAAKLEEL